MAFQAKYEVSGNLRNFILTFQFPLFILETRKTKPQTFNEIKRYFPDIWNEVDKFRTEMMFGNITKVIDQGKKEGLFLDYPTPIVMNMLVASIRTIVNPEFILNNNFSIIEAARTAFKIIIGGIVTKKGKQLLNYKFEEIK